MIEYSIIILMALSHRPQTPATMLHINIRDAYDRPFTSLAANAVMSFGIKFPCHRAATGLLVIADSRLADIESLRLMRHYWRIWRPLIMTI